MQATTTVPTIQPPVSTIPEIEVDPLETKPSPPDKQWATIRDTIQGVLKVATDVKDIVGEPAGPIIGLLAGTGLTIIEMLNVSSLGEFAAANTNHLLIAKDMEDNREDAVDLGLRISELLQIVAGFLENRRAKESGAMYATTIKHLKSFST